MKETSIPDRVRGIFQSFIAHKCTNLSAALSYYTVFSIGPFLVVLIAIAGIFYGREAVTGHLFAQIQTLVGEEAALGIQTIIEKASAPQASRWAAAIGLTTLFFGATGVFLQIKDSLNIIWEVKPPAKGSWMKMFRDRFLSFGVILGIGFLLLVSLAANTFVKVVSDRYLAFFSDLSAVVLQALDVLLSIAFTTVLFAVMFRVLPDAKIRWRDVWPGALWTAVLFALGRVLIGVYLGQSHIASTYGAAASVIVLIVWIYYSSLILFFGAEITANSTRAKVVRKKL